MKLFLSVKIELYFEYDFKYIIFKISTSPAPTSPNHRLTNANEPLLSLLLFCASKTKFNSFHYHSVHRVLPSANVQSLS